MHKSKIINIITSYMYAQLKRTYYGFVPDTDKKKYYGYILEYGLLCSFTQPTFYIHASTEQSLLAFI